MLIYEKKISRQRQNTISYFGSYLNLALIDYHYYMNHSMVNGLTRHVHYDIMKSRKIKEDHVILVEFLDDDIPIGYITRMSWNSGGSHQYICINRKQRKQILNYEPSFKKNYKDVSEEPLDTQSFSR